MVGELLLPQAVAKSARATARDTRFIEIGSLSESEEFPREVEPEEQLPGNPPRASCANVVPSVVLVNVESTRDHRRVSNAEPIPASADDVPQPRVGRSLRSGTASVECAD